MEVFFPQLRIRNVLQSEKLIWVADFDLAICSY